ncbi:hypothetical protein EG329_001437 [Mollisiaceae sp. DMI_Dod_QoI]|nr:hypothetical protein EG329_001437 [Helotiales sp. DMI_Dod_QoI]
MDDRRLGVTSNLLAALIRLRPERGEQYTSLEDPFDHTATKPPSSPDIGDITIVSPYIWIDAICINQNDCDERSHEVLKMGRIYESAAKVVVWLGPSDDRNDDAFDFLKSMAILKGQGKGAADLFLQESPTNLRQRLKSLHFLALKPWFSRTWVIQEVVMSAREPIFCWGKRVIMFDDMIGALAILGKALRMDMADRVPDIVLSDFAEEDNIYLGRWIEQLFTLDGFRIRRHHDKAGVELGYLLLHNTTKDATDPRDKVYAALGMCEPPRPSVRLDASNVVRGHDPNSLIINYSATVTMVDVYASLVESIQRATQKLDIIYTRFPVDSGSWPSWVPGWNTKSPLEVFSDRGLLIGVLPMGFTDTHEKIYAASGDSIASASFERVSKTLTVKAILWDVVSDVCGARWRASGSSSRFKAWVTRHRNNGPGIYGTLERADEAMWRTLVANRAVQSEFHAAAPDGWVELYREWLNSTGDPPASRFTMRMSAFLDRTMIVSSKGYIGLTPPRALSGDRICIILGCSLPVILRKVDNGYRLIGDSYVHGIMQGEVMRELEKGNVELEDICLI